MNAEFEKLYMDYWNAIGVLAYKPNPCPTWDALVEWSKAHKKEAVDCIIEMLQEEPSDVVGLCEELFPDTIKSEGFIPLDTWCNLWLNILLGVQHYLETGENNYDPANCNVDHYEDYRAYHKYMQDHYIPWNPFHEDDPNITLEEFKQGKRNDEELLKKKLAELNVKQDSLGYV